MCWLFKSKVNGHFGTLRVADSPSAAELRPAEVWKPGFCKNTKWPPEVWFGLEIFWSENKSCSFLWIIGGVQKLGPVRQKLSELRLFFSFAYFGYWQLRNTEGLFCRRGCEEQWYFFEFFSPPIKWTPPWVHLMKFSVSFDVPAVIGACLKNQWK